MADELIRPRDLLDAQAVRKMCGRALRDDRKPITRHTLVDWRAKRGFPDPLDAAGVTTCELWDRRAVKRWITEHGTFIIGGHGRPRNL